MTMYYTDNVFYLLVLHGIAAHWLYRSITNLLTGDTGQKKSSKLDNKIPETKDTSTEAVVAVKDASTGVTIFYSDCDTQTKIKTKNTCTETVSVVTEDKCTSVELKLVDACIGVETLTFDIGVNTDQLPEEASLLESIPIQLGVTNFDEADELAKSIQKNQITEAVLSAGASSESQLSTVEDDFEVLEIVQKPATEHKPRHSCPDLVSEETRDTTSHKKSRRRSRSRNKSKKSKVGHSVEVEEGGKRIDTGTWTNPVYFESRRINPKRLKKMQYLSKLPPVSILLRALMDSQQIMTEDAIKLHLVKTYQKAMSNRDTQFLTEFLYMEDDLQLIADREWALEAKDN